MYNILIGLIRRVSVKSLKAHNLFRFFRETILLHWKHEFDNNCIQ